MPDENGDFIFNCHNFKLNYLDENGVDFTLEYLKFHNSNRDNIYS